MKSARFAIPSEAQAYSPLQLSCELLVHVPAGHAYCVQAWSRQHDTFIALRRMKLVPTLKLMAARSPSGLSPFIATLKGVYFDMFDNSKSMPNSIGVDSCASGRKNLTASSFSGSSKITVAHRAFVTRITF